MRHFIYILIATFMLSASAQAETIVAELNGLVCAFCAKGVEKNFRKNPAVESVKVDLATKKATITTKQRQTLDDAIIKATVTEAGYTLVSITRTP